MTLKELERYKELSLEIEDMRELELSYREKAIVVTQQLSDVPGSHSASDKVGKIVSIYTDLENEVIAKEVALAEETKRIKEFIDCISDPRTRRVFSLRFLHGMDWEQVSERMGISIDSAKKRCYRYLDN